MNKKLQAIVEKAAANLIALAGDGDRKIGEAWASVAQDAKDNGTKPVFKLGLSIVLDLDKDKMETALTWGFKHKLSVNDSIPDPTQPGLPGVLEDASGTVSAFNKKLGRALKGGKTSTN